MTRCRRILLKLAVAAALALCARLFYDAWFARSGPAAPIELGGAHAAAVMAPAPATALRNGHAQRRRATSSS